MRYSYEFKRKCVEMYYRGEYPDTPDGIRSRSFHDKIREWVRIEESCGPEALRNKCQYKELIRLRAENEYMKAEIEVIYSKIP